MPRDRHGDCAIIRAASGELLVDVAEALLAGGVDVMEVTFAVPGARAGASCGYAGRQVAFCFFADQTRKP